MCTNFISLFSLALTENDVETGSHVLTVLFRLTLDRTMDHLYFQGHTRGEVMSAVPYMSGFIFRICVIFLSNKLNIKTKIQFDAKNIFFLSIIGGWWITCLHCAFTC